MKVSIEISLYPLKDSYEKTILDFLAKINAYESLEIETNGMSTQIFGEYEDIMQMLHKEMEEIYEEEQAILVMKMGKGILK